MKSSVAGKSTAKAEVTGITANGIRLLVAEREYFLPYEQFPWFRDAAVSAVLAVHLLHRDHLYWPHLDVDLEVSCLENAENYPILFD